jgi:hypothetical protein
MTELRSHHSGLSRIPSSQQEAAAMFIELRNNVSVLDMEILGVDLNGKCTVFHFAYCDLHAFEFFEDRTWHGVKNRSHTFTSATASIPTASADQCYFCGI